MALRVARLPGGVRGAIDTGSETRGDSGAAPEGRRGRARASGLAGREALERGAGVVGPPMARGAAQSGRPSSGRGPPGPQRPSAVGPGRAGPRRPRRGRPRGPVACRPTHAGGTGPTAAPPEPGPTPASLACKTPKEKAPPQAQPR